MVRNLFKGLLTCYDCGQVIETKIGSYKNVKGTLNHYADYICRGVKNKNGCTNKGRVRVCDFEAKMFQHVLNLNDFSKQTTPTNDRLQELENRLAKTQSAIGRHMTLLESEELSDMKQLSANLARLNKEQGQLEIEIQTEKAKASVINNAPRVIELLRDKFSNRDARVVDGVLRLIVVSQKLLDAELARLKEMLTDTEERKRIKNMMPTVFDSIRIQFGEEVKAFGQFVDGRKTTVVIKRGGKTTLPV